MCITSFCIVADNFLLGKQIYFFFLYGAPSKLEESRWELGPYLGEDWWRRGRGEAEAYSNKGKPNVQPEVESWPWKGCRAAFQRRGPGGQKLESGAGRSWRISIGYSGWGRTCPGLSKTAAALLSCKCDSHWALLIPIPSKSSLWEFMLLQTAQAEISEIGVQKGC